MVDQSLEYDFDRWVLAGVMLLLRSYQKGKAEND